MRLHIFSAVPLSATNHYSFAGYAGLGNIYPDGKYAYPSSGEVIDVKTRKILYTLQDEHNNSVASEKMMKSRCREIRLSELPINLELVVLQNK